MTHKVNLVVYGLRHPHAYPYHGRSWWFDLLERSGHFNIVAGVDHDASGRQVLSKVLDNRPVYETLSEACVWHECDAVAIFVPNAEAYGVQQQALTCRLSIFSDKPATRTAAEAAATDAHITQAGLVSGVGLLWRYDTMAEHLSSLIASGHIGRVYGAQAHLATSAVRFRPRDFNLFDKSASGGGILHWLGIHWIDILTYLLQQPITGVQAITSNVSGEDISVEDAAVVALQFSAGAVGSVQTGYYLHSGNDVQVRIWGSEGSVVWDPVEARAWHTDYKNKKEVEIALPETTADASSRTLQSKEARFLADFATAVQTGVPCRANLSHIALALQVIEDAYAAGH